jgi:F-type H+-transporting ATPase subunit gamma
VDVSELGLTDSVASSELEIEPDDDDTLLDALVQKYVEYTMFYALLDSLAAEHSARMQAMDAATNNAGDMVKKLSVKYNKARQESITTELIEIISGMESLK